MQLPIIIGLRRSSFVEAGLLLLGALLALLVVAAPYPKTWRAIAGVACWLGLVWAWRRSRPSLLALRLEQSGGIAVSRGGQEGFVAAELLPGATVHPWLTVFRTKLADGQRLAVVVAVDSMAAEDFRRLRVFLRWRAKFTGVGDDA